MLYCQDDALTVDNFDVDIGETVELDKVCRWFYSWYGAPAWPFYAGVNGGVETRDISRQAVRRWGQGQNDIYI